MYPSLRAGVCALRMGEGGRAGMCELRACARETHPHLLHASSAPLQLD
jgi:hypothetical protein